MDTLVSAQTQLRMRLLGGFTLEYGSTPMPITSQRIQALLAYLLLHRDEAQPRQRVAFLLWPDSSESQAHTNLRTLLHRLHTVFPQADQFVQTDTQDMRWLGGAALELDLDAFEQAITQANAAQPDAALAALERAAAAYTGDLLPDCYDEWLIEERERLRHLLFTALERLVALLESRRAYAAAIPHARRLASLDALNEASCLLLMRLHTLNGDRASALRVYHSFASTLQNELGTAPGAALYEAYERLLTAEAAPTDAPSAGMHAAPLVGRAREWNRMQATWQVAASGQPRLLLLWGEAGIGKTRLAEDLLAWAHRQGIITAAAQCYAAEGDLAYAPVTALLRSDALRPGIARLSGEWLAEVSRLAPDLPTKSSVPPRPLTERWQRQRLFEALAKVVLAPIRPTLLLIDDLQWCDHDTLEWLHFLLRYQTGTRLLVVGTIRAEEVTADHSLIPLLESLRRENRIAEIALNPLSREETVELAGHVAGRALSSERNEILYRETEGNPLFVVEMLRATANDTSANRQTGEMSGAELPPSVQAVVTRRLSQLSPAARAILEVAAVIGRSFTFEVVTQAVDLDEDAAVRGLDELWQRRVVREQGADAYDFTHGKLRAVAYAELSTARQRVLHRRVAEALESEAAANLDTVSGQIAAHYQQAGRKAQAVAYHRRAADYARRLYANEVAIMHLQQALALGDQQEDIADLSDQLGEVLHFVGRYDEARTVWGQALEATPERDRIARANLYRKLCRALRDQYRYDEAWQVTETAEAELGILSDDSSAELWGVWGQIQTERLNLYYWLGQPDKLLSLLDQLQELIEQGKPVMSLGRLHQMSSIALLRADRYDDSRRAVEHSRAYLRLMNEAGNTGALPAAHFQFGFTLLWGANDLDGGEQEIQTGLTLAQQSGDISLQGRCLTYLTMIARLRGEVEQTRSYAEQSLKIAEAGQMTDYIGVAHSNLGWAAWREGDFETARAYLYSAVEIWKPLPAGYLAAWSARLPLLALEQDSADAAVEHARVLLDERQMKLAAPVQAALQATIQANGSPDAVKQAVAAAQAARYL